MCSKRPGIWRLSRFLIHAVLPLLIRLNETYGWNNNDGESDTDKYYQSGLNYWLGDMTAMSVVYHGCVWGYTDDYGEDAGCMEAESEDGTTDWYRMANCRRAQVAYSVYGSESSKSASCDSKTFLDTYATKTGLYGWAYYLENYDGNAPITTDDLADLPYCEEYDDYHYMSIGCSSTGTFTIDLFSDEDCLTYNSTYDDLADINSALSTMSSCYSAYSSSSGYTVYNSFIGKILGYSDSCSPVDSQICQDANGMKSKNTQYSSVSNTGASSTASPTGLSFVNQVKYGVGSVFLFSSFLMFLGILFTIGGKEEHSCIVNLDIAQSAQMMINIAQGDDQKVAREGKTGREVVVTTTLRGMRRKLVQVLETPKVVDQDHGALLMTKAALLLSMIVL
eukprot:CAMPEP_0194353332 /NCGR_PEP_ID=MMETSP0174-20130528/1662_1 /TAXON_ID=216777 /ORGANISM="Proboscia alata, Strain PI-D3" /LENGTH=392 /DNA_ID=CAMNT_0039121825 /DNA_START=129 /DNA_END=1308 /DNA_ORIENTATION=+